MKISGMLVALVILAITSTSTVAWEPAPEFPDTGQARSFAAGLNVDGTIFVIGGFPLGTDGDKDTPVHFLLPGDSTWSVGPFAEGRIVRQGAGVDSLGRIIVFGGVDGVDPGGDPGASYVYDPIEGQAQAVADRSAAAPEDNFAWATDSTNRIYSLGGGPGADANQSQPNSAHAERYDGATDMWTPIAPLPFPVADAAAVYDDRGHILVLGGYDEFAGTRLASAFQYDIAGDTWSAINDMPAGLTGHRAVLGADERIYVLGGETGPVGSGSTTNAVYVLHLETGTWSTGPSMLTPRRHFATVRDDSDYIYAMGGENDSGGTHLVEKLYTPPCPTVTVAPESVDVWEGTIVGFSVEATGGLPLSYQWRKDGVDLINGPTGSGSEIIGATTMNLTIDNPGSSDAGMYDVVVSNVCGSTVSSVAELTIRIPPEIPTHWQAVSIHPGWAQMSSRAMGIGGGRIGGDAVTPTILPDGRTLDLAHPVVWDTNTLVGIDATPPGSIGGGINDVEGDLLGGWFWHTWNCPSGGQTWTCAWQSAGFWTAPSLNFAEASHSSGAEYDYIYATDGERLVGTLVYEYQMGNYDSKAHLWTAANQGISLHFAGATDTVASAIDGDHQYGWYRATGGSTHAVGWSDTATSGVDMHPSGYATSVINGAGDGQAVGTADSNAGLWGNTADAFINLNPQGATSSAAMAAHDGLQAGNVAGRAALWSGSPVSYVDLGAFVPTEFTSSFAEDFEVALDGAITVVGYGYNPQSGRNEALVWRSIGVPGDCDGDGDVDVADYENCFAACLLGPEIDSGSNCAVVDFDVDGDIDLADFSQIQTAIGAQ